MAFPDMQSPTNQRLKTTRPEERDHHFDVQRPLALPPLEGPPHGDAATSKANVTHAARDVARDVARDI